MEISLEVILTLKANSKMKHVRSELDQKDNHTILNQKVKGFLF